MTKEDDRNKLPPEVLEGGDDVDLEDISVIIEPDVKKEDAAPPAEDAKKDGPAWEPLDDNKVTQIFRRYEETDLTAEIKEEAPEPDESEIETGIYKAARKPETEVPVTTFKKESAMPSVIIQEDEAPRPGVPPEEKAVEPAEAAKPQEAAGSISISHVRVIGEPPIEKIVLPAFEEEEAAEPVEDVQEAEPVAEDAEAVEELEEVESVPPPPAQPPMPSVPPPRRPSFPAPRQPSVPPPAPRPRTPEESETEIKEVVAAVETSAAAVKEEPEEVEEIGDVEEIRTPLPAPAPAPLVPPAEPSVVVMVDEADEEIRAAIEREAEKRKEPDELQVEKVIRAAIEQVERTEVPAEPVETEEETEEVGEIEEVKAEAPAEAPPPEAAAPPADSDTAAIVDIPIVVIPKPPTRPSKEPPRPPPGKTVEQINAAPPAPVPRGVSMKSIVTHIPSILAIPEDEIPRERQLAGEEPVKAEAPSAAQKALAALIDGTTGEGMPAAMPDYSPALEVPAEPPDLTEVTEVEEAPLPEPVPKPKKRWYEELFNEDYIRLLPPLNSRQKKREVAFIETALGAEPGGMILDLACGTGVHCIGLALKGYQMVGLDLSFAMLAVASEEAQAKDCKINFIQKDLRELDFEEAFDAAYCIGSSFGYFDDDDNLKVLAGVHKALKPGGIFLLEVDNRDFVIRQTPGLLWFEGDGVATMEETSFDFITSRLKVRRQLLFEDGGKKTQTYSIRMYSIHELGRMMHKIGFRVDSVGGHRAAPKTFIGEDASKIIIVAQKRFPDEA